MKQHQQLISDFAIEVIDNVAFWVFALSLMTCIIAGFVGGIQLLLGLEVVASESGVVALVFLCISMVSICICEIVEA